MPTAPPIRPIHTAQEYDEAREYVSRLWAGTAEGFDGEVELRQALTSAYELQDDYSMALDREVAAYERIKELETALAAAQDRIRDLEREIEGIDYLAGRGAS